MLKSIETIILASKPYLISAKEFIVDKAQDFYVYVSSLDFSGIQAAVSEIVKSII